MPDAIPTPDDTPSPTDPAESVPPTPPEDASAPTPPASPPGGGTTGQAAGLLRGIRPGPRYLA